MDKISPMMQHYLETKEKYNDCILFYRLGDFYEMFYEDAKICVKELDLVLTGKDCGLSERAPMCGIPFHSANSYINRLVTKGYKVAIAEQVEDPKKAKGLVKREVTNIITPGTVQDIDMLEETRNNYLMGIIYMQDEFAISTLDISTGEFSATRIDDIKKLMDEIYRIGPKEILVNHEFNISGVDLSNYKRENGAIINDFKDEYVKEVNAKDILLKHFKLNNIEALGIEGLRNIVIVAGGILSYVYDIKKNACSQITDLNLYSFGQYMLMDGATSRNLELTETMRGKNRNGSLLHVLDKTCTAMGARKLRRFIERPLIDENAIILRQDAVACLFGDIIDNEEIREYLNSIYDLERIMGRVASQNANTRDLIALKSSVEMLPHIKNIIAKYDASLLKNIYNNIDELKDIHELIEKSVQENSGLGLKDGDIIKTGYNSEIDMLRLAKNEGKSWIVELEEKERNKTGIKNLRIKYNKVFGYYFEVTNSFISQVPDYFVRKQTLTNAERYSCDELKNLEEIIVGSQDKLNRLEYEVFVEIRQKISDEILRIKKTADAIALLDALVSLAQVAYLNNYVRPIINNKNIIDIKNGRHPVIECLQNNASFIANDTYLDNKSNRIAIITGPNMAGKSTYMRQTALICLMAQIGSFVPADSASICISDRIFTRVGASDDLSAGKSTFMVEMTEVANILRNASKKSLIILDEIGRGTSTFDGLSIAWSVVEYISSNKLAGAKTLFATHYHELTELEGSVDGVNNYCIAVKENNDDIVFLRKIIKGGADKSYGILVAKLAGVPDVVIKRANELLAELSDADITYRAKEIAANKKEYNKVEKQSVVESGQLCLFETIKNDDIIKEIDNIDLSLMRPIDALNMLSILQNKIRNRI